MKKNKILYILLTLMIGVSSFSCQDEFESKEENLNQNIKEETVINGRFNFSSTESLNQMIKGLNTKDITIIENKFETYYRNGFRSHNPIINPNNEELLAKFAQEYSQKKGNQNKSSENDDDDSFIADPLFAALINDNNEIIVGDTIYKFTKNKGLYFANVKDSVHLINFVENKELNSKSNIINHKELMVDPCEVRALNGGITQIDQSISMYIAPIDEINGCTGGGGSGGGTIPSVPQTTDEEKLQEIISNLPVCEGKDNWINNLFGKSYWCIEHFDDRHRIKTEFWDQKWLIYASSGIFTKTQVRTLGVYWASDSDEIHLGINRILLRYNFSQPDYKSLTHPNLFNTAYKAPLYMYKGDFMVNTSNYYVNTTIEVTKNSIPFFDFESSEILNIYIPNAPLIGDFNLNLTTQDITSQSNIKALYKMGIDFLKDKFNSGAKKEFAIIHQKNLNEIEVIYFGERYKNTNDNKIEHKFYSDVSFLISTTWNDSGSGGNWKYTVKPAQENFRNYTYYELDFYGLARRGTTWKGSRMVR